VLKRGQKQQASSQSATEVRLNQAREDVQKYKSLLQKAQADAKVILAHLTIFVACFLVVVYNACQVDLHSKFVTVHLAICLAHSDYQATTVSGKLILVFEK